MSVPVSLRRFDLSDLDDFWVWASDEQAAATCSWEPYKSKDDLLRYMEESVIPNPWYRAIIVGGRAVGALTMKAGESPRDQRRREMGYVVAREWWGRGVASVAVRMAIEAAMEEIQGLERIEALVAAKNKASQRVLEKIGLRREGVLKKYLWVKGEMLDIVMFSFIRGDTFLM